MTAVTENTEGAAQVSFPAPDWALTDTEGVSVRLSDYWTAKTTVLVFLRHFGCTFCREQVAQLKREYARFQALGAEIVCVAQGDAKSGKGFAVYFDLPFPLLLCGDDVSVYHAYGLGRGTAGQLFGLSSFTRGLAATLSGHFVGKLVGDGFQMPGVFIVDRTGTLKYARPHKDAADNPDPQELLRAVEQMQVQ